MSICSIDDGPIGGNNFGQSSMLNKFGNSGMMNDQRDNFNFGSERPAPYQRPSFSDFTKGPNGFNTFGDRDKEL